MIENKNISPTVVEFPAAVDPEEAQLVDEVSNLWKVHFEARTSVSKTLDELKLVRADLSQRLHALKAVLSRPGRGGAWSSFLVSQTIPRSTADRLVRTHKKTLSNDSCATEQIPAKVIRNYVNAIWPRLRKVLETREAFDLFVAELHRKADASFADSSSGSSPAKGSGIPSYLARLNLPVSAVSDNAAHA